jgi:hypothetical protein
MFHHWGVIQDYKYNTNNCILSVFLYLYSLYSIMRPTHVGCHTENSLHFAGRRDVFLCLVALANKHQ